MKRPDLKHNPVQEIFEIEENVVQSLPISKSKKEKLLLALDLIINIIIIVVLVTLVRRYLISPFQVFGPSMCNSLNHIQGECRRGFGEYLIINKAVYQNFFGFRFEAPQRGDIIVFRPPGNKDDFYIKRVIGLPGEIVEIKKSEVFVENDEYPKGLRLNEPYLREQKSTSLGGVGEDRRFTVPEGHYFLLGDNRRESSDSRSCFGPTFNSCKNDKDHFVSLKDIQGKSWLVLFPFSKIRIVKNPVY